MKEYSFSQETITKKINTLLKVRLLVIAISIFFGLFLANIKTNGLIFEYKYIVIPTILIIILILFFNEFAMIKEKRDIS